MYMYMYMQDRGSRPLSYESQAGGELLLYWPNHYDNIFNMV